MMEASKFIDYYELLEISPNANSGTIERMFRYFAQRYHPDNKETNDRRRFDLVLEAHSVLGNAENRTKYDIDYKAHSEVRWEIAEEVSNSNGIDRDAAIQNKMLAILYARRRQNIKDPGLGNVEFEPGIFDVLSPSRIK